MTRPTDHRHEQVIIIHGPYCNDLVVIRVARAL